MTQGLDVPLAARVARAASAIVGIGPGNGAALARRFGADGGPVALLSRSTGFSAALAQELPAACAYAADAGQPEALQAALAQVAARQGPVGTLVYNAGSGAWGSVEEVTAADLEQCWRVNTLGLFAAMQAVLPGMKRLGGGAIVVIGATASRRGGAGAAAFAQAKAAQRTLAESMARQLWPQGIHVALIVIDGIVDLPRQRERFADKGDDFFVQPAAVAESAWWLTQQPRSAWSFEIEARPFAERW
ncbi:MAG: SDR family NAD(P)-dependent oxidoreductase [Comamonas sp.]|nr:SDR family NAD(P)-dependent oxidoreductase [Comamonas sp.]